MARKYSAELPSTDPKYKKAGVCLTEKMGVLHELHSGMTSSTVGYKLTLMNQQYRLNKVSLKRNTHKVML